MAVDPGALQRWSGDGNAVRRRLTGSLATTEALVARIQAAWTGEAAERFAHHCAEVRFAGQRVTTTLGDLVALVDTAHDNYTSAARTNARMWPGPATAPAITAMSGGGAGIDADPDDVLAAAIIVRQASDLLGSAWQHLSDALAATAAMAGDDPPGQGFARDHDPLVSAAWSGWEVACTVRPHGGGG